MSTGISTQTIYCFINDTILTHNCHIKQLTCANLRLTYLGDTVEVLVDSLKAGEQSLVALIPILS